MNIMRLFLELDVSLTWRDSFFYSGTIVYREPSILSKSVHLIKKEIRLKWGVSLFLIQRSNLGESWVHTSSNRVGIIGTIGLLLVGELVGELSLNLRLRWNMDHITVTLQEEFTQRRRHWTHDRKKPSHRHDIVSIMDVDTCGGTKRSTGMTRQGLYVKQSKIWFTGTWDRYEKPITESKFCRLSLRTNVWFRKQESDDRHSPVT